MGSKWLEVRLSDAVDLIGGGTPKRSIPEYWGGTIPWLSVKDFNHDYRHVDSAEESITELGLAKSSTKLLLEGQLIISARGTVGALAQLSKPMAFNQSCYGINAKAEYATDDFLYYLFKYSIANLKQITHGAVFDTITRETFDHIIVNLPPLPKQRAIAHILGSLDDKIELNRRMNKTLEAMARTIFKSWFVDFLPVRARRGDPMWSPAKGADTKVCPYKTPEILNLFPDSFEDSDLGEIPKGWEWRSLYDSAKYVNGAAYRNFHFTDEECALPIIKIAELKNGVSDKTKFTKTALDDKYRIDDGEILLSWSGNPDTSIGTFVWSEGAAWLNQHIFRVLPHQKIEKYFVFYLLKYLRPVFAEIARNKQTTGLGHFTARDMKRLMVVHPPEKILAKFNDLVGPIFDRWYGNLFESHTLASLREALLPKLISGKLRVPDAKKFVEEVGSV